MCDLSLLRTCACRGACITRVCDCMIACMRVCVRCLCAYVCIVCAWDGRFGLHAWRNGCWRIGKTDAAGSKLGMLLMSTQKQGIANYVCAWSSWFYSKEWSCIFDKTCRVELNWSSISLWLLSSFWYSVGPLWLGLFCRLVKELYGTRNQCGFLFLIQCGEWLPLPAWFLISIDRNWFLFKERNT